MGDTLGSGCRLCVCVCVAVGLVIKAEHVSLFVIQAMTSSAITSRQSGGKARGRDQVAGKRQPAQVQTHARHPSQKQKARVNANDKKTNKQIPQKKQKTKKINKNNRKNANA